MSEPTKPLSVGEEQQLRAKWISLFYFAKKRHTLPLVFALVFTVAGGLLVPLLALILGKIFNGLSSFGAGDLSAGELMTTVTVYCIFLMGIGAATWIFDTAFFSLWVIFGELQAKHARESIFEQLLWKDLEWFDGTPDGLAALLPRIQANVRDLQLATSQPLGSSLQDVIICIATLSLAFYISWSLTLVCLATAPICAVIIAIFSRKMQPSIESQQAELTKASKVASNAISSIDAVKHFNGQESETNRYKLAIQRAAHWYRKEALYSASQIGSIHLLTFGIFVQGFWYGGILVARGSIAPGDVLTAFWACLQATQAIEDLIPQLIVLEKGRTAAAALKHVLKEACHSCVRPASSMKPAPNGTNLSPKFCEGDIKLTDVTFAYPSQPDRRVLDNCSFFFPAGDVTFVVGRSGSGKSTLGNLLMRFYAPTFGEILVDDRPIQTLDINWIRNNFTLVQQQSILFNETILKNITFGARNQEDIQPGDISTGIRFAGLNDTIHNLPDGLDTVVGLSGNTLSGGQRQRVALARARLRETPVLILDESTSALDYAGRVSLMNSIRAWRKGKTTIVITHDLSQIRAKDFVYVMDNSKIVCQGYKHVLDRESKGFSDLGSFRPSSYGSAGPSMATTPQLSSPLEKRYLEKRTSSIFGHESPRYSRTLFEHNTLTTPVPPFFRHRFSFQSTRSSTARTPTTPGLNSDRFASLVFPPADNAYSGDTGATEKMPESKDIERGLGPLSPLASTHQPPVNNTWNQPTQELNQLLSMFKIFSTVIPSLAKFDRLSLVAGFIAAFFHAAATPCFSYLFSQLLGTFFLTENRTKMARQWALAVLAVSIANGIASFWMHYLFERCGQAWVDHLRHKAIQKILRQNKSWFERDTNSLSNLANCLDRNPEEMRNLLGRFACFIFVAIVMAMISICWGVVLCWKLTLVGSASAPILYGLTRLYEKTSGTWENRCNEASEVMAGIFSETFLDIRTVRSLTLESYFHNKHYRANSNTLTLGIKRACYSGCLFGLSESSILFVYALVFYYGTLLVTSFEFTTKSVLTVFSMLLFTMTNVKSVLSLVPQISSSRDTASRVLNLVNNPNDHSHEDEGKLRILHPVPMKFTNLSFSYPSRPEKKVLENFNLTIKENTCTAIVGPSGSGKSTIASLLLALYPPSPLQRSNSNSNSRFTSRAYGNISLGGLDIRQIHVPTLRSLISIVPQNPTLFPASISDNISYGLHKSPHLSTASNIKAAAVAAGIDEFISSLPSGYDTMIGDGGTGISGGQAQRLVIARALVRRPRVLILDEATSNLDNENAALIKQTVTRLMESREMLTVIIITHSRSLMEIADNVVVVDQGKVVEEGPYEALTKRTGGELRRLLRLQGVAGDGIA